MDPSLSSPKSTLSTESSPQKLELLEKSQAKPELGVSSSFYSINTPLNGDLTQTSLRSKSRGFRLGYILIAAAVVGAIAFGTLYITNSGTTAGSTSSGSPGANPFMIEAAVKCKTNAECSGATPYCLWNGNCVACSSNWECAVTGSTPGKNVCSAPSCVQCLANAECSGSTPICNTKTHTCTKCSSNSECSSFSQTPVCSTAGTCVQCNHYTDCPSWSPVCNSKSTCSTCSSNSECSSIPGKPWCVNGLCVSCKSNAECSGTSPFCRSDGTCQPCS